MEESVGCRILCVDDLLEERWDWDRWVIVAKAASGERDSRGECEK